MPLASVALYYVKSNAYFFQISLYYCKEDNPFCGQKRYNYESEKQKMSLKKLQECSKYAIFLSRKTMGVCGNWLQKSNKSM